MRSWNKSLVAILSLIAVIGIAAPAVAAPQLGAGLHYLHTLEDFGEGFSQHDFSIFGSVTLPVAMLRVEGDVEWIPDYLGGDNSLWQPSAYAFLPLGLIYGGAGIGIGYLDGEWASNPWYGLRAGVEFGLGGLALDGFLSYRFQSANFGSEIGNLDLDALTLGAQVKFGG
ncbi:hypothetical protein DRQ53_03780 [bacterium]|nr:MAG: hypothetical protein DRQ32_04135 [bacterium]RKZ17304.1 MAG: hypothetical protein DRQ53_03780 [bacterium]